MMQFRLAVALVCCAAAFSQPLRDLAARRGIRIGAAVNPARLGEPDYAGTLAREFDQAEPENAMKFGPIHPGPATYNFGPADAVVSFAREHGMAVRGHTLVWHRQNAAWVTGGELTPEQLSAALREHIRTVLSRYAGQVYAWDVVNEAFNEDGTLRSTVWSDAPGIGLHGTAYIEQAFRWAHEADAKALLFYNDYSAEATNLKSDAIYEMAKDFKKRGVPIDGVGLQMHLTADPPPLASVAANTKRLIDLGLQVHITELDVRLPLDSASAASPGALDTQARIYGEIAGLCARFEKCTAVQLWGFTDRYSWVPGAFKGTGAALPFDSLYRPKPAYEALRIALKPASGRN